MWDLTLLATTLLIKIEKIARIAEFLLFVAWSSFWLTSSTFDLVQRSKCPFQVPPIPPSCRGRHISHSCVCYSHFCFSAFLFRCSDYVSSRQNTKAKCFVLLNVILQINCLGCLYLRDTKETYFEITWAYPSKNHSFFYGFLPWAGGLTGQKFIFFHNLFLGHLKGILSQFSLIAELFISWWHYPKLAILNYLKLS